MLWCPALRVVDVGNIVLLDPTALHTPNDKEDPSDELQNCPNPNTDDAAVEFAIIIAVTVAVAVVRVGIVAIAGRFGGVEVCANQGCSDNEEDDCGDGETDRPPFHEAGSLWIFRHGEDGSEWVVGFESREN